MTRRQLPVAGPAIHRKADLPKMGANETFGPVFCCAAHKNPAACVAWSERLAEDRPLFLPARLPLKLLLVVAAALVDSDNRVLIAQRPEGKALAGLWEFPGGKIDPHERPEQALIRELHEELGIHVKEACLAPLTFASYAYPDFHLMMPLYICRRWEGLVTSREGQALKWVRPNELRQYPMPPADEPLIPALIDIVG